MDDIGPLFSSRDFYLSAGFGNMSLEKVRLLYKSLLFVKWSITEVTLLVFEIELVLKKCQLRRGNWGGRRLRVKIIVFSLEQFAQLEFSDPFASLVNVQLNNGKKKVVQDATLGLGSIQ